MRTLLSKAVKFVATLVIVASVFGPGTPLPTLTAHAQTPAAASTAGSNTTPAANPSASNVPKGVDPSDDIGCLNWPTNGAAKGMAICVSNLVYFVMVGIGSWAANITAYIFDYAIQLSLTSGAYALDFIAIGWGIVRDVANMSFLFILVYIAFKIMFQAETAGTIRMLVWVVVIALLVNFSFLMTRVVIDGGNIVALQFYNAIAQNSPPIQNQSGSSASNTTGGTKDLTSTMMGALNVQYLTSTQNFQNFIKDKNNSAMYVLIVLSVIYFMVGIAFFMLAATFIFVGVKFVLRVIGLWFVIIGAPIAFVAAIFRGSKTGGKWFSLWLGYLVKFSFYPAIFLFMYYIQTRFMLEMVSSTNGGSLFNDVFSSATATANVSASASGTSAIVQAIANIGVRLGFILATMYITLRVADWAVDEGSSIAGSVQGKITGLGRSTLKWGGLGASRLGGLAYQQTVGRGAANLNNTLTRQGTGSSALGYRLRQGLQSVARSSVGGTRSYQQFRDTRNSELNARDQIRDRASRREAAQGLVSAAGEEKASTERGVAGLYQAKTQEEINQRAQGQANASALYRAAKRESAPEDITSVTSAAIPTGTRRLPGGVQITQVQGGSTGLTSTPINVSAQRALEEIKEKAQKTAQAGAVAITLTTTPDMSRSSTAHADEARAAAPLEQQAGAIRDEIRSLGQTMREAVSAAKSGTAMPQKVVVSVPEHIESTTHIHNESTGSAHVSDDDASKIAKKLAHKLEPVLSQSHTPEPTPPAPAAPAAVRPMPPEHNDLGTTVPKAA